MAEAGEESSVPFQSGDNALLWLRHAGSVADEEIDLAEAALALGLIFLPGVHVDRCRQHLRKISEQLREECRVASQSGAADDLVLRVKALRKIMHEDNGYDGDEKNYDDIQNVNFIRVIERRKGLPISLGILYIFLARGMGWVCEGLSFPGHFLVRLEAGGDRVILDPFKRGREMDAAALRDLLKSIVGKKAELSHNYYDAVSNRDILVRLVNNLKKRLIDAEDYAEAIRAADAIGAFSPDEYRIYLDKGVLYAKLGKGAEAIEALETYISRTPFAREKQQAHLLLQQIKSALD